MDLVVSPAPPISTFERWKYFEPSDCRRKFSEPLAAVAADGAPGSSRSALLGNPKLALEILERCLHRAGRPASAFGELATHLLGPACDAVERAQ